jgi:hypothetical protein
MSEDWKDEEKDPELAGWLRLWEAPAPSGRLDDRVGASYRSGIAVPFWKRVARGRVVLPVPVAALFAVLLLLTGSLAIWGYLQRGSGEGLRREAGSSAGGLADLRPLPEIRLTVLKGGGSDAQR